MATRLLTLADEAKYAALYELARVDLTSGLATFWPEGAPPLNPGTVAEWITRFRSWGSFSGTTLRGAVTARSAPIDGEAGNELYIWITLPSLTTTAFKTVSKELLTAWWTAIQAEGVPWGWGMNVMTYPTKTETLFARMITVGMSVETRTINARQWRIVKMQPTDALTKLVLV